MITLLYRMYVGTVSNKVEMNSRETVPLISIINSNMEIDNNNAVLPSTVRYFLIEQVYRILRIVCNKFIFLSFVLFLTSYRSNLLVR